VEERQCAKVVVMQLYVHGRKQDQEGSGLLEEKKPQGTKEHVRFAAKPNL
jgi:hypothetical protein